MIDHSCQRVLLADFQLECCNNFLFEKSRSKSNFLSLNEIFLPRKLHRSNQFPTWKQDFTSEFKIFPILSLRSRYRPSLCFIYRIKHFYSSRAFLTQWTKKYQWGFKSILVGLQHPLFWSPCSFVIPFDSYE